MIKKRKAYLAEERRESKESLKERLFLKMLAFLLQSFMQHAFFSTEDAKLLYPP